MRLPFAIVHLRKIFTFCFPKFYSFLAAIDYILFYSYHCKKLKEGMSNWAKLLLS